MNEVSWLLYIIDRVGFAQELIGGTIAASVFAMLAWNVVGNLGISEYNDNHSEKMEHQFFGKKLAYVIGVLFIFLLVTPNTTTMKLIAVSELSEQVIHQPETKELFGNLITKLNNELKED